MVHMYFKQKTKGYFDYATMFRDNLIPNYKTKNKIISNEPSIHFQGVRDPPEGSGSPP